MVDAFGEPIQMSCGGEWLRVDALSVYKSAVRFRIVEQKLRGENFAWTRPETPRCFSVPEARMVLISDDRIGFSTSDLECNLFVRGSERGADGTSCKCGVLQWGRICTAVESYNEEMGRNVGGVGASLEESAPLVPVPASSEPGAERWSCGGEWLGLKAMAIEKGRVRFRIVEQKLRGENFAWTRPETPRCFSVPEAGVALVSSTKPKWKGSPVQSTLFVRGSDEKGDDIIANCGVLQWGRICKAVDLYNEEMGENVGASLASVGVEADASWSEKNAEVAVPKAPAASEGVKAPEVVPEASAEDVRLAPGSEEGVAAILRLGGKVVYVAAGAHVTINIG